MKKIKVKLKDITIINDGPHLAKWEVKGVHQCWIGRAELTRIIEFKRTNTPYYKRLTHKLEEFSRKGLY